MTPEQLCSQSITTLKMYGCLSRFESVYKQTVYECSMSLFNNISVKTGGQFYCWKKLGVPGKNHQPS